jgi:hypothetical protein
MLFPSESTALHFSIPSGASAACALVNERAATANAVASNLDLTIFFTTIIR